MKVLTTLWLLVLATVLETSGDAVIRVGLRAHPMTLRVALIMAGAILLACYGLLLNLAPLDWGRLIGVYVAVFFVVGQILNLILFQTSPTLPVTVGGAFIIAGALVITLWRP